MRLGSWHSLTRIEERHARTSHDLFENWRGGCASGQEPWEEQRWDLKGHHGKAGACGAQEMVRGGDDYGRDKESVALHSARTQRPRGLWAGSGWVASQWPVPAVPPSSSTSPCRPPLFPPRAQSPPSVPPPARPPPSAAAARRCRRTCSPAGTRRRRRDGQGSESAVQRPEGQSLPAAPAGQAAPTRHLLPPLAFSPQHRCAGGQSCGPASSEAGTPRRELKVGTSRAAAWRDPAPASGAPGSARGRGPGAPLQIPRSPGEAAWAMRGAPTRPQFGPTANPLQGSPECEVRFDFACRVLGVPREELKCRGRGVQLRMVGRRGI